MHGGGTPAQLINNKIGMYDLGRPSLFPSPMKKIIHTFALLAILLAFHSTNAQSFEYMQGSERVFVDAQWLKTFDSAHRWSLFSRSRATVDYQENTSLFTGAYLNYTSKSGFGGTLVGAISDFGMGADAGAHFFKANPQFLIYALLSVKIRSEFGYAWFSILRYTPRIAERWKVYSSLELYSSFDGDGHEVSVQRIRAGLDRKGYQFGLALNLSGLGRDYATTDTNPGLFIRKQF